ncbi:MAG: hypothetical protein KGZ94_10395 [Clostridia bacterium]|nr:hypothetical protein [Clostridia bacterium]
MDKNMCLDNLKELYQRYHDLKAPPYLSDLKMDLYAHFYQTNQKYFGSKKITLWRLDNEEHCFTKYFEYIDIFCVNQMVEALKIALDRLVKPHPDHMKTVITGVIVANGKVPLEVIKAVKKFSYKKVFKLYLFGWAEIRLVLIDLSSRQVICNASGREVQNFFEGLFNR